MAASNLIAETKNLYIDGAAGKLSAVIQKPNLATGQKCNMVMLLHGFMGTKTSRPLTDIADELEKKGIASIRFDFNRHGESEGASENMTVLNEIEDAKRVFAFVSKLDYVKSISMCGYSQGGVVSSMLAGELGINAVKVLVLLSPAAVLRDNALEGSFGGMTCDASNPPETLTIGDFKIGRNYILTAQTLPIFETAQKYTGPVCLIHGTEDLIVPYQYSERYQRIYKNSELHLIPGADHTFTGNLTEPTKLAVDFFVKNLL